MARISLARTAALARRDSPASISSGSIRHAFPVLRFGTPEVESRLQVEPERGRGAEIAAQSQGGFRRDGSLAAQDGSDPVGRHAQRTSQRVGGEIEVFHPIPENCPRRLRRQVRLAHLDGRRKVDPAGIGVFERCP